MHRPVPECRPSPVAALKPIRALVAALLLLGLAGAPALADEAPAELPESATRPLRPIAVARVEGTVSPGLRVNLCACDSEGGSLTHRWVQVAGPPVELDAADRPDASFVVPTEEGLLDFLLIVGNGREFDTTRLSITVEPSRLASRPPHLVADAGDDQIGIVGQQITLNGIRSRPHGRIGYRWLQVDGPPASLSLQDDYIFAFVPPSPGSYRFALVVAEGGQISEPSFVDVEVGVLTPGPGPGTGPSPAPGLASGATATKAVPIDQLAAKALGAVPGGPELAEPLASQFEAVASKMSLYESYADAYREIALRLEALLPDDPDGRDRWARAVFEPLTRGLVEAMRPSGVDLSLPGSQAAPLGPEQRGALRDQFREIAAGFRKAEAIR